MKQPRKEKNNRKARQKKKAAYKVRNWAAYNDALVRRGSLEVWIEEGIVNSWNVTIEKEKRKRGAQPYYSQKAIEMVLTIGQIYHQRLRQTEGFVRSVFRLAGMMLLVPDYSTLSRRGESARTALPTEAKTVVAAIIDSTGIKVYGEGEWKVRQHGWNTHRTWLKLHISIDVDGEIRALVMSDNSTDDAEAGIGLLNQQQDVHIDTVKSDGAYDKAKFYDACLNRNISHIVVPPRTDAKIWYHGNRKGTPHPRDENLRAIRKSSRKQWKKQTGYHQRSNVETTMYRYKTMFGEKVYARETKRQYAEIRRACIALNRMKLLGMPESYPMT